MSARTRWSWSLGLSLFAVACESDNVRWAFVSNPGGTAGGGGIIIIVNNNGGSGGRLAQPADALVVAGRDELGTVTTWLPHGGDGAVLERASGVEVRSPALPAGAVELPGAQVSLPATAAAAFGVQVPASELLHDAVHGPGLLTVAARGTWLVLAAASELVLFAPGVPPEVLPSGSLLTSAPDDAHLAVLLPDGLLRVLTPEPPPTPAQRMQALPGRLSVRLLGPAGECLAELPSACIQLQHGAGGLFLTADLPRGTPAMPLPIALTLARDNRYLLAVRAP